MTPLEEVDEQAASLIRIYAQLDELALTIRTHGDNVRVIAPDYDRNVMAKMLRIAASMLEEPADYSLN